MLIPFCPIGSTVTVLNGPVLAKDNDVGSNAVVKYKLLGARMDIFTVDVNTGKTANPSARIVKYLSLKHRFEYVCLCRCRTCASGGQLRPRGISRASG